MFDDVDDAPTPADSAERLAFLSGTSFFGGLPAPLAARLAALVHERRFSAGDTVFSEGEPGKSMYIVGSGELILRRHCGGTGEETRLQMMRRGDFFGVTALIDMEPRPFSCVAERDSVLYELTNAGLYQLYKEDMKGYVLVLQNINRELSRRLRKAASRISALEELLHKR
jgi:CRP-like cAMP-binding protein